MCRNVLRYVCYLQIANDCAQRVEINREKCDAYPICHSIVDEHSIICDGCKRPGKPTDQASAGVARNPFIDGDYYAYIQQKSPRSVTTPSVSTPVTPTTPASSPPSIPYPSSVSSSPSTAPVSTPISTSTAAPVSLVISTASKAHVSMAATQAVAASALLQLATNAFDYQGTTGEPDWAEHRR